MAAELKRPTGMDVEQITKILPPATNETITEETLCEHVNIINIRYLIARFYIQDVTLHFTISLNVLFNVLMNFKMIYK